MTAGDRSGETASDDDPTAGTGRRRARRATRPGTERAVDDAGAWEDDDRGWGEPAADPADARDGELRRDVPPHWS